ncbi:PREDICTED: uncharacterized protein LOC104774110 [Camelina sativa]|uniref:Uncharacterized protein LOC104720116 n=1 Tax=Camelina sativa TaxID=90675 RepID=A0ABM0Y891_CAMSA|nr:PREDICTED: uncharacterized protein LOC104720116 [Camelina sativa]XP_010497080.1 PREDICTED: uncharacterized protein LOC104774110 [Camelina sativa]
MDVSHILLGRPWEFDRKIIHDGAQNTYSFIWDTHQILLLPSKEHSLPPPPEPPKPSLVPTNVPPSNNYATFCSFASFDAEFRKEGIVFALLSASSLQTAVSNIDPQLAEVLREFDDVFSAELPSALPPLRNIQHQIDLIPGASLPNRPHYRMKN